MVNRNHADTPRNSDRTHDRNSSQHRHGSAKAIFIDDIITSLANAHENRRARQVTEWQSVAANSVRAAARG
jgi:predicted GNAT family acetyltransferase